MSLVSRSILLYGNRSISYFGGSDGKKQRNETKLHGFSHSIEAPRLDILKPYDLDYKLRVFRAAQGANERAKGMSARQKANRASVFCNGSLKIAEVLVRPRRRTASEFSNLAPCRRIEPIGMVRLRVH